MLYNRTFEDVLKENAQISINSAEDCKKAFESIVEMLQNLTNIIETEQVNEMIDYFLPNSRLQESDIPTDVIAKINNYNANTTSINKSISAYLIARANKNVIINGMNEFVKRVNGFADTVNNIITEYGQPKENSQLYVLISMFDTILTIFNLLVSRVDKHNSEILKTEIKHDFITISYQR